MPRVKRYIIEDSDGDYLLKAGNWDLWTHKYWCAKRYRKKELPRFIGKRELTKKSNDPITWKYIATCGLEARPVEV